MIQKRSYNLRHFYDMVKICVILNVTIFTINETLF